MKYHLTLLHSEWPKLYRVLAILSAIGLSSCVFECSLDAVFNAYITESSVLEFTLIFPKFKIKILKYYILTYMYIEMGLVSACLYESAGRALNFLSCQHQHLHTLNSLGKVFM